MSFDLIEVFGKELNDKRHAIFTQTCCYEYDRVSKLPRND